ncbi:MAG: DEAD/DEAH box helicase [Treponema sp.]|nr:DEAD/DEAH box helicase [Treponema sp.]
MKVYPGEIENLPVYPYLDEICSELKKSPSRFLLLSAETGAGKSTAVPLALLRNFSGGMLMLEPRRLAVVNCAQRVSSLLGESVGGTCGYVMHLENKRSEKTRFTFLTEAVLSRMIQSDPSLEGISVVVLDEFHERSVNADLALAFLKEAVLLREDLYVIVMSATMDFKKLEDYLGCSRFEVPGKLYPVETEYRPGVSAARAIADERRRNPDGTVLAFFPGIGEIRRTKADLEALGTDCEIRILHSSVPPEEQREILRPSSKPGIILSSAIAETSVTVPGVTSVVDSGWMRINEYDPRLGMERLVTRRVSEFNAVQRKGRAGRLGPGRCVRLWDKNEPLSLDVEPEILRADLMGVVLECAEWGNAERDGLSWLDAPSEGIWKSCSFSLDMLGCIKGGKITALGKACLSVGLHPRMACVALAGFAVNRREESLSLIEKYSEGSSLSKMNDALRKRIWERICGAGERFSVKDFFETEKVSSASLLLSGYPDRLAVRTSPDSAGYRFPSGRIADVESVKDALPRFIVAPLVDSGASVGKIRAYEAVDEDEAMDFMKAHSKYEEEYAFEEDGRFKKTGYTRFGKIELSSKKIPLQEGDYAHALCSRIRKEGMECLPHGKNTDDFLLRVKFFIQASGIDSELKNRYENLSETAEDWLFPFISPGTRVNEDVVYNSIHYYLDGNRVDRDVPIEIVLENGKRRKIRYEEQNGRIVPVMEVIIQQLFGCFRNVSVMGVPVVFRMLSPARRPLQVTSDLENFWTGTWPEICSEMKSRYPKHNWNYKISDGG